MSFEGINFPTFRLCLCVQSKTRTRSENKHM